MAMKPCRECKKVISTDAKTCPSCGASSPTRSRFGRFLGGLFVIGIAWVVFASISPEHVNNEVAKDVIEQYEVAKRTGSKTDVCVHAGLVYAAFVQAKDSSNAAKWKAVERADCARAGVPGM